MNEKIELPAEIAAERAMNTGIGLPRAEWAAHLLTVIGMLRQCFPVEFDPQLDLPAAALCMSRAARVKLLTIRESLGQCLWHAGDRLPGMEGEHVVRLIHHDQRNGSDRVGAVTTIKEFNRADDETDRDERPRRIA